VKACRSTHCRRVCFLLKVIAEVRYDQVTANRFRHGTRLIRWRPDKSPQQCTFDQLEREARPAKLVVKTLDRSLASGRTRRR
jgi:ATP-dependent DNA ligase